jgi:RNA polymerase sigma factor (sigma-70 family)
VIAGRRDGALLHQLRTLYNIGAIGDLTDGQLVERFATDAGEAAELAFAALVERHQSLVWRVCLAITRDRHQAEDAFQATFLVLVRKARSLWVRDSLGPWLHQVACRTASCHRTVALRRRRHERRCAELEAIRYVETVGPRDPDRDAAVHEELGRLPEKYRAPLVLCDLEGRTHQEAARSLGWPIGTVKTRQSQGRRLMRDRLMRRGLGPAVAVAAVESLRKSAPAATPAEAMRNAIVAAMWELGRLIPGYVVSAHVLTLTRGVLQAMLWNRLRYLVAAALAVGIASGGASVYVLGSQDKGAKDGKQAPKPSASAPAAGSKGATGQPAAAEPRAQLRAQQIATRKARAAYEIARLTRELAELAVEEYEEVGFPRDLAAAAAEINSAEADLTRHSDRADWAERMLKKGYVSQATKASEDLSLTKARFALEQSQTRRKVLVEYTRGKTIKELRSEVEKARVDELSKQEAYEVETIKETELKNRLHPGAK